MGTAFTILIDLPPADEPYAEAMRSAFPSTQCARLDDTACLRDLAGQRTLAIVAFRTEAFERLRALRTQLPGTPTVLLVDEGADLSTLPEELDYFPCPRSAQPAGIVAVVHCALNRQFLPSPSLPLRVGTSDDAALTMRLRATLMAFRRLHELVSDLSLDFPTKLHRLLGLGTECFALPIGIFAHIRGERYQVVDVVSPNAPIHPGALFHLPETYCERTVTSLVPVGFEHAALSEWHAHPCYRATRLEAYLGMPVTTDEGVYGTINFSSPTPVKGVFHPLNVELLKAMARWVGTQLQQETLEAARRRYLAAERGISEASRNLLRDPPDIYRALQALAAAVNSPCTCLIALLPGGEVEHIFTWPEQAPWIEGKALKEVLKQAQTQPYTVIRTGEATTCGNGPRVDLTHCGLDSIIYLPVHGPRGDLIGLGGFAAREYREWDPAAPALRMAVEVLAAFLARRAAESQLRLSAQIIDATSEAVLITDPSGKIEQVNRAFEEITGYAPDEVIGHNPNIMRSLAHDQRFFAKLWQSLLESGYWRGEIWDHRKNGELFPKLLTINAVRDEAGATRHYVGVFSDISAIKSTEQRLEQLAHYDLLTGLPNRALLEDRLRQAMAVAERDRHSVALLFVDLDRFKVVNDTLGHATGDLLLAQVATRLRHHLRGADTLARISGDEFIAILTELESPTAAAQVAKKFLDGMAQPFLIAGHELVVSASIGIAVYPSAQASDQESLLRAADTAMYEAKSKGRNTFAYYHGDLDTHASIWLTLTHELRRAMQLGELELHYQPKWDVIDDRITGVEALLRWHHPQRGLLMPGEFVDIADESGVIVPLGRWVLRSACRQAAAWRTAGLGDLPVAVNVAGNQLLRGDLAEMVEEALADSGLPPSLLELELSEKSLLRRVAETREILQRIKNLGVRISIDDFGTGYTSISYLRHYPIDILKLDRSFLNDVPEDRDAADLCSAIISIGESLHLDVIAEGIERPEQLGFVRANRCRQVQGYLVSPPMVAAHIPDWIQMRSKIVLRDALS